MKKRYRVHVILVPCIPSSHTPTLSFFKPFEYGIEKLQGNIPLLFRFVKVFILEGLSIISK